MLEDNPDVDKIHTIDKSISEVLASLKEEKFDRIIDLHNNIRTLSLKKKLGVRAESFPKLNLEKWLLVKLNVDKMPDLHVVDRYYKAVEGLGVKNTGFPCSLHIKNPLDIEKEFGFAMGTYITVSIGAQFNTKRMPHSLLIKIINQLNAPAILIGGETDNELATEIMGVIKNKKVVSAVGKYSLKESASIIAQSTRLLTNDTGMMHIATCFNIPVVSVWGNTVPELGMYPYYPKHPEMFTVHEVKGLKCRPCSKIGFDKCPKGHFDCMNKQNIDEIVNEVND